MLNKRPLLVIPARLKSTRLPEKLLSDIHGKPMIYWTYKRVMAANVCEALVATDSEKLRKVLENFSIPCVMTSSACRNGTERVFDVSQKFPEYDFFLNVQADEPLLNPRSLRALFSSGFDEGVFKTAVSRIDFGGNESEVKVALSFNNRIRFASRASIPNDRSGKQEFHKIHGIYSYSRDVLERFVRCHAGPLEIAESVEQLRCIEHDIPLVGVVTPHTEISVDTIKDLEFMRGKPIKDFDYADSFA